MVIIIYIYLMTNGIEYLFMGLLAIRVFFCGVQILCPFLKNSVDLLSCKSSLYSLDTSPLSGLCIGNIFFQSVHCLFI